VEEARSSKGQIRNFPKGGRARRSRGKATVEDIGDFPETNINVKLAYNLWHSRAENLGFNGEGQDRDSICVHTHTIRKKTKMQG